MWGDSDDEIETVPTLDAQEKAVEPGIRENKEAPTKELESTNEAEEKTEAAAKIQAVQRGNQARKEIAEKQEAAAKIQAVQRGNQARKEIAEKQEAAAKIQAIQRGNLARQEIQDRQEAAEKIQAIQRGRQVRQEMQANGGKPPVARDPVPPRKKQVRPDRKTSAKFNKEPVPKRQTAYVKDTGPAPPTPSQFLYAASNRERTMDQAQYGQARIKQRVVQAPSSELHKKSCLRNMKLPKSIPAVPVILVMGDLASLENDHQQKMFDLFTKGILRAAASVGALVVDTGLASGPCAASPPEEYADFCRKVCTVGISPSNTEDPLSKYHTHQLVLTDFNGWEDGQGAFVKHKVAMVRRLAGQCRVVTVLINNGYTTWTELIEVSRQGWPTVVIENSGDLADEIANATKTNQVFDLNIKEIVSSDTVMVLDKGCQPSDLAALLQLHLTMDLLTLRNQGPLSRSK